jgi:alginate O-acetyltransferase complex protein AlgI
MLFNSLTFVVFFIIVLAGYRLLGSWSSRKWWLLAASYLFYAAWNPPFALLLAASTVVDWWVAQRLGSAERPTARRIWLLISLVVNFGILGWFKYGTFLIENSVALLGASGIQAQAPVFDIILPVGISFYTFQTLSYTIDVYRRELKPEPSLRDFALYVSFFPQLVAGPIVRARDFLHQLVSPPAPVAGRMGWGLFLMTLGLFQKVVLADTLLAPTAELVFTHQFPLATLDAWAGVLAFSFQILFDFAGYSTCAIGAALCFGFSLCDNFRFPYAAVGFSDFWRRWHISLSTWLRDYLYIPLGGNRCGATRNAINLMLVMLLGGLWHGAAWTFVVWGGLHGLYLLLERVVRATVGGAAWAGTAPARFTAWLLTFIGVVATWVFFRAGDLTHALHLLRDRAGGHVADGDRIVAGRDLLIVGLLTVTVLLVQRLMREHSLESVVARTPPWLIATWWAGMALALVLARGNGAAFIYFQF